VTTRQELALSFPTDLRDALSLLRLIRFVKTVTNNHGAFGTVLIVEQVERLFQWHVSVSTLDDKQKPIPLDHLTQSQIRAAEDIAQELLDGVGIPDSDEMFCDKESVQIIRKLTIDEKRRLRS
jgi:hypothetical protein